MIQNLKGFQALRFARLDHNCIERNFEVSLRTVSGDQLDDARLSNKSWPQVNSRQTLQPALECRMLVLCAVARSGKVADAIFAGLNGQIAWF